MWAHDRLGERRLFEGYVYLVHERLTRDAGMHVYHYGAYEKAATTQLMGVYATREDAVDELLRRKGFPPSTASHAGGHWFKSSIVHHETSRNPEGYTALRFSILGLPCADGTWSGTWLEVVETSDSFPESSIRQVGQPEGCCWLLRQR